MPVINITKTVNDLAGVTGLTFTATATQGVNVYPLTATYTAPNLVLTSSGSVGTSGNFDFNIIANFTYLNSNCTKTISFTEFINNVVDLNSLRWSYLASPLYGAFFIDNNTDLPYKGIGVVYNPTIHSLADSVVGGWGSFNGSYGAKITKKSGGLFLKLPGDGVIEFETSCPVAINAILSGHMFYMLEHKPWLSTNTGKNGLVLGVGVRPNYYLPGPVSCRDQNLGAIYGFGLTIIGYGPFGGTIFLGAPRTYDPRFPGDANCLKYFYRAVLTTTSMFPSAWTGASIPKRIYRFEFIGTKIKCYDNNVFVGETDYDYNSEFEFGFIVEGSTYYGGAPTHQYRFIHIEGNFNV